MAQEDLTKIATEELEKRAKLMKIVVWAMAISMVIMAISGIILSIKKGFSALSTSAICFLPLIIIFSVQLKKITEELKSRVN
jgi:cytochrome b subunit of formate dehydrogenase